MSAAEADAFFQKVEDNHKPKAKELQHWLNRIAFNLKEFNRSTHLLRRDLGKKEEGKACGLVEMTPEEFEGATNEIMACLLQGETKLKNGKGKGQWNNGTLGSRWWDWESEDGKTTCRIAFFSKKFSENWTRERDYAITLDFEKSA